MASAIPKTQTVALIYEQGGPVHFKDDYPVPTPGHNEVLAKVLYTGVCQSDLHTKNGTSTGPTGHPITNIKLPHIGGHEGIGRIIALGPNCNSNNPTQPELKIGALVGIRFSSRVCRRCEFCLAGTEQYCVRGTNHLHHEDGSFQEYIALDADYLTVLPEGVDERVMGPVLCAGLTAYKAVLNTNIKAGQWLVVVGAGGGLGHLAVQYAQAQGALVIGIDTGPSKQSFITNTLNATAFIDYNLTDPIARVHELTGLGAHAAVVTAGHATAFAHACKTLRVGGTLSCVGIPPGRAYLETPIATIVIKGLRIVGSLVGSLKECLEAVEFVRRGVVRPEIQIRGFRELGEVYEEMERGDVAGRVVLRVGD